MQDVSRYARHIRLPFCGLEGQERISRARILVVGAGGLGCPLALYLAGAGVGHLRIVDDDRVEASNLHRQTAFMESDIGHSKARVLAQRCRALNSEVEAVALEERLHSRSLRALLARGVFDLVIDASDSPATRYLVSDACFLAGTPHVFGAVNRTYGQLAFLSPQEGHCVRALFGEEPALGVFASCSELGVLGPVPGILGAAMATEALQWILDGTSALEGRLLLIETRGWDFQDIRTPKSPKSKSSRLDHEGDLEKESALRKGSDLRACVLAAVKERESISLTWEEAWRQPGPCLWLDVREADEREIDPLPVDCAPAHQALLSSWPLAEGSAAFPFFHRPEDTVLCVCRTGARSHEAARRLRARGVDARSIVGGLKAHALANDARPAHI